MQWFKFVQDNVVTLAGYTDRKEMGRTMFYGQRYLSSSGISEPFYMVEKPLTLTIVSL